MKKKRVPRKIKKKWKKMGILLIIPSKINQEFINKWSNIKFPLNSELIDSFPINNKEEKYIWKIQEYINTTHQK